LPESFELTREIGWRPDREETDTGDLRRHLSLGGERRGEAQRITIAQGSQRFRKGIASSHVSVVCYRAQLAD
jgi:hypothetical protein